VTDGTLGRPGPLRGVRVLDLTRFPPGAYCTQLLVQLGADVCRVEPPGAQPAMAGVGVGLSAGKRSVAVDLRHSRGTEVLRRLAGWADVLVENNRPGELDQRGFGYGHAAAELPRLIWCSITGFGQDGPYAMWAGHDLTYTAHSGLLAALDTDLPWHPQMMLAVPIGAVMAVSGIAAALYDRERTGVGGQIDISLAESATWLLSGADSVINGSGWGIPPSPDRRLYQCSDGKYVTVAAAEPRTWKALCAGLGFADLAGALPARPDWDQVTERLAQAFLQRPAADWIAELGPTGAAIGAVNVGPDLKTDPQVQARGGLIDVDGVSVPANPVRFRNANQVTPGGGPISAPAVGADTRAVLMEAGYGTGDVDALVAGGAVAE
jgi:alpha-methylacyl-CoA racemase